MKERTSGSLKKHRATLGSEATLQTRRAIAALGIVLGLTILLTPSAFSKKTGSQAKSTPQPDTGITALKSIDATGIPRNDPSPYPISFEKLERYQGRVDIKGDGSTWRAVRFDDLPSQVSLVVAEASTVYPTSRQSILAQQWHPFKTSLPIIIIVEKTAALPIEISYELSTVRVPPQGVSPAEAQQYVSNPDNVDKPQVPAGKIRFEGINPPPSPNPTTSPTGKPTASPSAFVIIEEEFFPLWLKIAVSALVAIMLLIFLSMKIDFFRPLKEWRRRRSEALQEKKRRADSPDPEMIHGKKSYQEERRSFFGWIFRRSSKKQARDQKFDQTDNTYDGIYEEEQHRQGRPSTPPPTTERKAMSNVATQTPARTLAAGLQQLMPGTPQPGFDDSPKTQALDAATNDRFKKIEEDYEKLQLAHRTFVDRVQEALNPETGLPHEVEIKVNALREELKNYYNDYYEKQSKVLLDDLSEKQEQINQIQKSSDNARTYMQSQVEHFEETVKRLIAEAKQRETELQGRHSKILGEVLGLSIETLKEGKFEVIVEEACRKLNQFFSEQPAKADGLNDLHRKAQAINSEMQTTLEKVRKLKPELGKLEPYAERAKDLASELRNASSLQGQPRTFKITLDFPAAKFTKAREIFLEDLGKAVKEQIDRLDDPHAFWSKELEVFATSDIVALADICDVEVTGRPGSNQELEQSLTELFRQAGLTAIVPAPGEPFKPGEQHLIEMVSGPSANSQKIKRVVKRGFYYTGNEKDRLIRKAGVDVFR